MFIIANLINPPCPMQTLKEETRRRILDVARREFIAHGASGTSIRTIAHKAGMTVGNVYNYFRSKDELFREVLRPLIDRLDSYLLSHNKEQHLRLDVFDMEEPQNEYLIAMHTLIRSFRPELRLLLSGAEGTSLAGYKERITDHQTRIGTEYLRLMKERYPHLNTDISPFLLRIAASTWVAIFCELVYHEEYTEEEIELALRQYARYGIAGWKALMQP